MSEQNFQSAWYLNQYGALPLCRYRKGKQWSPLCGGVPSKGGQKQADLWHTCCAWHDHTDHHEGYATRGERVCSAAIQFISGCYVCYNPKTDQTISDLNILDCRKNFIPAHQWFWLIDPPQIVCMSHLLEHVCLDLAYFGGLTIVANARENVELSNHDI